MNFNNRTGESCRDRDAVLGGRGGLAPVPVPVRIDAVWEMMRGVDLVRNHSSFIMKGDVDGLSQNSVIKKEGQHALSIADLSR